MSRHSSVSSVEFDFVWLILLAGTYWAHKELINKITIVSVAVLAAIVIAILMVKSAKLLAKLKGFNIQRVDLNVIDGMSGLDFERYVAKLLERQGYGAVRLTEKYDYGVDIIAVKDGITWGIQVKRYSDLVKASAIRQVVTALKKYHCDQAMVVTNSYYSEVAKELARVNDCKLLDRESLKTWLRRIEFTPENC